MGNSMVTNNLSDIEAERLHTALSEYNILRSEYSAMITRQFSVISLTITALSVLFGFVVTTFSHENRSPALLPCIFCVLIPSVAMFTGAIWLDTVYRQKKLTAYLCLAEIRINRSIRCPVGSSEASAITWECYEADDQGKGLLGKPNRWYYYYCLAFYIVFPWVSALFDIFVMGDPIYIWCIISLAIYLGYISFVIAYCKKILRIEAARKNRFKIVFLNFFWFWRLEQNLTAKAEMMRCSFLPFLSAAKPNFTHSAHPLSFTAPISTFM